MIVYGEKVDCDWATITTVMHDQYGMRSPLQHCSNKAFASILKVLFELGLPYTLEDSDGFTLFMYLSALDPYALCALGLANGL